MYVAVLICLHFLYLKKLYFKKLLPFISYQTTRRTINIFVWIIILHSHNSMIQQIIICVCKYVVIQIIEWHWKVKKVTANFKINDPNFPEIGIFTYNYNLSHPKKNFLSLDPSLAKVLVWCLPYISWKWVFSPNTQTRRPIFFLDSALLQLLADTLTCSPAVRSWRMSIFGVTLLKVIDLFLND